MHIFSDMLGQSGMAALFRGDMHTANALFTAGSWVHRFESALSYTLPGFLLGWAVFGNH